MKCIVCGETIEKEFVFTEKAKQHLENKNYCKKHGLEYEAGVQGITERDSSELPDGQEKSTKSYKQKI